MYMYVLGKKYSLNFEFYSLVAFLSFDKKLDKQLGKLDRVENSLKQ